MAAELVVNGGAELGDFTGWDTFADPSTRLTIDTGEFYAGAASFDFWTNTAIHSGDVYQWQYFPTVPGSIYEGTIAAKATGSPPGGSAHTMFVELDLEGIGFNTTAVTLPYGFATDWIEKSFTFVAQSTLTGIRVRVATSVILGLYNLHFYVDSISVPAVVEPGLLAGNVQIGDILDTVAFTAGDFSTGYRTQARTWLNMVRSQIATMGWWRGARNAFGSINVTGSESTGIYALKDNSDPPVIWSFVDGDKLLDTTNNQVLVYRDVRELQIDDPDLSETGQPWFWSDAGTNSDGEAQIILFPRPTSSIDLVGPLFRQLTALTDTNDADTVDPFFGMVDDWAACFMEGERYYLEQDENEQGMAAQWQRFLKSIRSRKQKQGVALSHAAQLRNLRPDITVPRVLRTDWQPVT